MPSDAAMAFVRGLRRVPMDADGEPLPADIHAIANKPGDPGWRNKLPPPEPDSTLNGEGGNPSAALASAPVGVGAITPAGVRRIVVSCARKDEHVVVGVEEAPDWELVSDPVTVPLDALAHILSVLQDVGIKVKDLTGGEVSRRFLELSGS